MNSDTGMGEIEREGREREGVGEEMERERESLARHFNIAMKVPTEWQPVQMDWRQTSERE